MDDKKTENAEKSVSYDESELKNFLFPYDKIRKIQDKMLIRVSDAIKNKKNLIMHAPTGIGKSAATIAPALKYAIENNKTVFFLTSRHTQHIIAISTLKKIKEKYSLDFSTADIIGKKWMCCMPGANLLYSHEFQEFCRHQVENKLCEFYDNVKSKKTNAEAKLAVDGLKNISPSDVEKVIEICKNKNLCAYEISMLLAKDAKVIVADYLHIFHPSIRENFFKKTGNKIENSIIIVDEAHNLGERVREMMSQKLSTIMIKRAIKEARKHKFDEIIEELNEIKNILEGFSSELSIDKNQKLIEKNEFIEKIKKIKEYNELIAELEFAADFVREQQRQSYIGGVAAFLEAWNGADEGFARILDYREGAFPIITLSYKCLDPSVVVSEVVRTAHSVICMSGTLTPTSMYRDILGFGENCDEEIYENPFPGKNRANLVIPETSTKYSKRNHEQYKRIAEICSDIVNMVDGSSLIFFPSYSLRDMVNDYFSSKCKKTIFFERSKLNKEEKTKLLEEFKKYKNAGAVLMCVASGSFSQGIDLPGILKAVIVVGLPLEPPNLETLKLIEYYDNKFGKGWDYGYILPAITKSLQAAGRCIRSETDKGIMVFLDERYAWNNYFRCFPKDWEMKVTKDYSKVIEEFFGDS